MEKVVVMINVGEGRARDCVNQPKTTQKTTQKILELLKDNPILSRKELADILGDITEDGVKYNLNKLKKEGKIKRVGSAKGGHWEVWGGDERGIKF